MTDLVSAIVPLVLSSDSVIHMTVCAHVPDGTKPCHALCTQVHAAKICR